MKRLLVMVPFLASSILFMTAGALPVPASAGDSRTAAEARAMLEKAVAALKANQAEGLARFNGARAASGAATCKYSALVPTEPGQPIQNSAVGPGLERIVCRQRS